MTITGYLITALLASGPVEMKMCPGTARQWSYVDGSSAFAKVQKGWSTNQVAELLGAARSCEGPLWTYVAGRVEGPELTFRFFMKKGKVDRIEHHAVLCRAVE